MSDEASASSASPAAALRALVANAVGTDPETLGDRTEVVERETGATEAGDDAAAPAERLAELVDAADSVVAVVPRFDADLARRLNASLSSSEGVPGEVRVVFTDAASDRLGGATGPVVRRALAERGVDAYRHDGESPVAVVLADDRAAVGLVDADGLSALLWTDAPAVREWAAATCRRYLDTAEPVTEG
ncbi:MULTISPECIES: hypothetical protein [Halorubrum]|uniref:Methanogenesis regulatory protein FilR1 middle domain-containing protein n=1 Tax=Halorubrum hochstenium ATCC 700873 TaxID=1227481 RepID=M0F233_9EURY|nr:MULTISPECIES: hypothetical protein [Halorubrum]ELZ53975.1 hypothetical protein C467_12494 [Halorubrum hochstenium ATCC 700873]